MWLILLGMTSCAHRYNAPIQYQNVRVEVVSTKASLTFFKEHITDRHVWTDEDEWDVSLSSI